MWHEIILFVQGSRQWLFGVLYGVVEMWVNELHVLKVRYLVRVGAFVPIKKRSTQKKEFKTMFGVN